MQTVVDATCNLNLTNKELTSLFDTVELMASEPFYLFLNMVECISQSHSCSRLPVRILFFDSHHKIRHLTGFSFIGH